METFDIKEQCFESILLGDSVVEHIGTGFAFTEGPVWSNESLLFSDIPNNRIARHSTGEEGLSITTFRYPSGNSNGLTLDLEAVSYTHLTLPTNREV